MKGYALLFFLLLNLSNLIYSQNSTKLQIHYNPNGEIILVIDSQFHLDYGCSYPITYKFEILQNSSQLTAFFRHSKQDNWAQIDEKSSSDFFNGIEAVRFDYDSNFVFLSIAFANNRDSTFIKITNNIDNNVLMKFLEVCKYYDNRNAVVTTTADDLRTLSPGFQKAFDAFRSRNLWLSCGVITGNIDDSIYEDIQHQIDLGLVEVDSHSRTHPHPPYDYESEIGGSKDDIINNLNLSPLYKNGNNEYVYAYIYPYGNYSHDIDRTVGEHKYLICRKVTHNEYYFTNWNADFNIYDHVGVVYEVGPIYNGVTDLNQLNSTFDNVLSRGEIYHFSIHPNDIETYGDWEKPYMNQHLDYISNRKNVWYTGFGALYLYHLLQESTEGPISSLVSIKIFLQGPYLSEQSMATNIVDVLPKNQPYSLTPWNYNGNESFSEIPSYDIVDWVLISLKTTSNKADIACRRAGLLTSSGNIVDIDGKSPLRFNIQSGNYFILVEHRNHLSVMSAEPVVLK